MSRLPKLCRHKASGKGYVTDPATGREHYFRAPYASPECRREYEEWIRALLDRRAQVPSGTAPGTPVTVGRLIVDFVAHAERHYRKDGKVTNEVKTFRAALIPLNERYGTLPADSFGPSQLKALRQQYIEMGWTRVYVNKQVSRVRRVWKWGVENEIVRLPTLAALATVEALEYGRSAAAETDPVGTVDLEIVEQTLPRLPLAVQAMVQVQLHADMRPGEVTIMRAGDIDRKKTPWLYVPYKHKMEHYRRQRRIYLGPKARAVLAPLLLRSPAPDAWLFPSAGRGRHAGHRGHWTVTGYNNAVRLACKREPPIPHWHPSQLRHTQSTAIREQFGIEGSQAVADHANLKTTEIYAERSEKLKRDIAEKIG